ncbi:MAG: CopK family periplasmic copper-binding protein [Sterolibacterium sp.]
MLKKLALLTTVSAISLSVFAFGSKVEPQQSIPLKEGSTVHIFDNGKMAMEDKWGRPISMRQGEVMEDQNGQKITMQGNEVARLNQLLLQRRGSPF